MARTEVGITRPRQPRNSKASFEWTFRWTYPWSVVIGLVVFSWRTTSSSAFLSAGAKKPTAAGRSRETCMNNIFKKVTFHSLDDSFGSSRVTCMSSRFNKVPSALYSLTTKSLRASLSTISNPVGVLERQYISTMASEPLLNSWIDEMESDDASLAQLQKRVQSFVKNNEQTCRLSLGVAGGGGNFLGVLASTPGASNILLQGNILYDRESYRRFVHRTLDSESFRYASVESAEYAAHAALREALILSAAADPKYGHHPTKNMQYSVGVGSASALRAGDGTERRSRAYCTVQTSDSFKVTLQARLAKTGDTTIDRTRFQEDVFVAHCIMTAVEYALQLRQNLGALSSNDDTLLIDQSASTKRGDEIKIQATFEQYTQYTTTPSILAKAAELILEGKEDTVLLVAKSESEEGQPDFQIVNRTVIPPLSLVFPGSFHPPHIGHVQLVKSAMEASSCETAWFELSLTNADKPPLEVRDVVERLTQFLKLRDEMPKHWGILLTNAPLFKQKVDLLYPLQASRKYNDEKAEVLPPIHFVIGTDTLVRILDPKYYNNSRDEMLEALRSMPCNFVVGGRLEQKNVDPSKGPMYVSGQEDVDRLPDDLRPNFTLIDGFRVDISSSEIRRQQTKDT